MKKIKRNKVIFIILFLIVISGICWVTNIGNCPRIVYNKLGWDHNHFYEALSQYIDSKNPLGPPLKSISEDDISILQQKREEYAQAEQLYCFEYLRLIDLKSMDFQIEFAKTFLTGESSRRNFLYYKIIEYQLLFEEEYHRLAACVPWCEKTLPIEETEISKTPLTKTSTSHTPTPTILSIIPDEYVLEEIPELNIKFFRPKEWRLEIGQQQDSSTGLITDIVVMADDNEAYPIIVYIQSNPSESTTSSDLLEYSLAAARENDYEVLSQAGDFTIDGAPAAMIFAKGHNPTTDKNDFMIALDFYDNGRYYSFTWWSIYSKKDENIEVYNNMINSISFIKNNQP